VAAAPADDYGALIRKNAGDLIATANDLATHFIHRGYALGTDPGIDTMHHVHDRGLVAVHLYQRTLVVQAAECMPHADEPVLRVTFGPDRQHGRNRQHESDAGEDMSGSAPSTHHFAEYPSRV